MRGFVCRESDGDFRRNGRCSESQGAPHGDSMPSIFSLPRERESACSAIICQLRNWMCGEEIIRAVGMCGQQTFIKRLFLFS